MADNGSEAALPPASIFAYSIIDLLDPVLPVRIDEADADDGGRGSDAEAERDDRDQERAGLRPCCGWA